ERRFSLRFSTPQSVLLRGAPSRWGVRTVLAVRIVRAVRRKKTKLPQLLRLSLKNVEVHHVINPLNRSFVGVLPEVPLQSGFQPRARMIIMGYPERMGLEMPLQVVLVKT